MKTLIFVSALVLVLASCKKDCPVPGGSSSGDVYIPDDPYSDGTYDPDPSDPDPYSDPGDPGDPSDPGDPGDPDDGGDGTGCSIKHNVHTVHSGKAMSFNNGGQTNRASGK